MLLEDDNESRGIWPLKILIDIISNPLSRCLQQILILQKTKVHIFDARINVSSENNQCHRNLFAIGIDEITDQFR